MAHVAGGVAVAHVAAVVDAQVMGARVFPRPLKLFASSNEKNPRFPPPPRPCTTSC